MIYNHIFKTFPTILHSPGDNPLFPRIVDLTLNKSKCIDVCENLSILTWNSSDNVSILERSLDLFGVNPIVLGKGINEWKNTDKIPLTIKALKSIDTKYVMGVDAYDAVFVRKPSVVLDQFLSLNSKMIFNATISPFPDVPSQILLEKELFSDKSIFCHLNAGVWIGEIETVIKFWDMVKSVEEEALEIGPDFPFSEQLRVKVAFQKLYPEINVDITCKLFQTIHYQFLYPVAQGTPEGIWCPLNLLLQ